MHSKSEIKQHNLIYGSLLAIVSTICLAVMVGAQGTSTAAIYLPPEQSPNQGALPPPGDGPKQAPVIPGDYYPNQTYTNQTNTNVPTGKTVSTPQYGTNFPNQDEMRRSRINLFMAEGRGTRTVLTFEPDQLTNAQRGQVMGIIGGVASNSPYQNIEVTQSQLTAMQKILAPYPATGTSAVPMRNGRNGPQRNQIFADGTPSARLSQNGTNGISPVLPEVRKFCRYLVILGVVCGCIFLAFAGLSLQFGDRNAGGRIIGATGGIMLLLMSYAIWKVVRINENTARGPEVVDKDLAEHQPVELESRSYNGDVYRTKVDNSFVSPTNTNLPLAMPGSLANPAGRSGLPIVPLGAAH